MAEQYLQAASTSLFNWYRIGPAVGKVAHDHPRLVTPLNEAALAAEKRGAQQARGTPGQGDLFV